MPQETLVMIYYAYYYSVMNYCIICEVIHPTATAFFSCKKKAVRIITGSKNKYSCHHLLIKLNILTLKAQYKINSDIQSRSSNLLNTNKETK